MFTPKIICRIIEILKSGDTCELKVEHGRLVIVRIRRKAEKTDFVI